MDISLALGGGGSRGIAHIGVISELERLGFRVKAIAGTSAGGIVAAFYAAGYSPNEMAEIFSGVNQAKLFSRSAHDGPGMLGLNSVSIWLDEVFKEKKVEELRIPCGFTAVDIRSAREVVITSGRLVDAILATIAIPGIFPPLLRDEHELVDGAVLDPVPVAVARLLSKGLPTVAVVLSPTFNVGGRGIDFSLRAPIPTPIIKRMLRTRIAQAINIYLTSMDVSARMLTELHLKVDQPDVIIRPDVGKIGILDKVNVSEIVKLGAEAVEAKKDELKKLMKKKSLFWEKIGNFFDGAN